MNTDVFELDGTHFVGESALNPMGPLFRAAALLIPVGKGPLRRRVLPATLRAAHSGTSN